LTGWVKEINRLLLVAIPVPFTNTIHPVRCLLKNSSLLSLVNLHDTDVTET